MANGKIKQTIGAPQAITSSITNANLTPYGNSYFVKQGHICTLNFQGNATANISAGNALISLPSSYKPKDTIYFWGYYNGGWHEFNLTTSAQIASYSDAIPSGATVQINLSFVS